MTIDLFGDVPVTIRDVELWLDRIGNYCGSPLRVAYYVLNWNVVDKIRAVKLDGSWDELLDDNVAYRAFDFRDRRLALRVAYRLRVATPETRSPERFSRAAGVAHFLGACNNPRRHLRPF